MIRRLLPSPIILLILLGSSASSFLRAKQQSSVGERSGRLLVVFLDFLFSEARELDGGKRERSKVVLLLQELDKIADFRQVEFLEVI
ncbi:hypothetical protein KFK09_025039 [Dendrobium nobile]|uniref:Uncharacterized protein n=1 Tax=Dendrobium nobile TaxID=94219 RepID=A0A8T3AFJ1_DENNO|nr:hypothetical protein KFK09_025039 [Dendrobium nobile]